MVSHKELRKSNSTKKKRSQNLQRKSWPDSLINLFESKFIKEEGCWNWLAGKNGEGYGCMKIEGVMFRASRIAYEIYVCNIPNGLIVCHKCDNRACVNPNHLFLGTRNDNNQDRKRKGRYRKQPVTERSTGK